MKSTSIIWFDALSMRDLTQVGGKNASLGEMISHLVPLGVRVPHGFAVTVDAYNEFLASNSLLPKLKQVLDKLDRANLTNLAETGHRCRDLVLGATLPTALQKEIAASYEKLTAGKSEISVAVRSSATAEDSESASFAGQHDSFLHIRGTSDVCDAVRKCYASLFNDRAIKYRIDNGFSDLQVRISVGIQIMVRSDLASAGVAFTVEPETGNDNFIYITGAWGLGESVVQGAVNTDEFYVFKPSLQGKRLAVVHRHLGEKQQMMVYGESGKATAWMETPAARRDQFVLDNQELQLLGTWCQQIEKHYGRAMDIEWAKDGVTNELFIVQARPETVQSHRQHLTLTEFKLNKSGTPLLSGKAVGNSIVSGTARIVKSLLDGDKVQPGDIIVADITNPDWNALLKKAVCIVTNRGGRTSHASIVARELGIPAVVGTISATEKLTDGQVITVSCAGGDVGQVYEGKLEWQSTQASIDHLSHTRTKPMFILADPSRALQYASYPSQGVGLLRMEFIVNNSLQIHPLALVKFDDLVDGPEKKQIAALTRHYSNKKSFFIDTLAEAIGLVAAAFYPREVIVRMSDFKTNEYVKLLGGRWFEPEEENPMLGFRGASRYYNARYREGFGLECRAILKVREEMGLTNVKVMIPFCRTVDEGQKVLQTMKDFGLEQGQNGLEVYVMAEIPSNILLARDFARLFDGFSIGSNDLTQLTLGLDRDSAIVSDLFDENNEAVKSLIRQLVSVAHEEGVPVGLCGQAPSDYPKFTQFLVGIGIDSISFNPDSLVRGIENIATAEKEQQPKKIALTH